MFENKQNVNTAHSFWSFSVCLSVSFASLALCLCLSFPSLPLSLISHSVSLSVSPPPSPSLLPLDPSYTCTNGHVRLVGGDSSSEGRVEICHDNHYGSVCNDGWGQEEAEVVCRQLGFQRKGKRERERKLTLKKAATCIIIMYILSIVYIHVSCYSTCTLIQVRKASHGRL